MCMGFVVMTIEFEQSPAAGGLFEFEKLCYMLVAAAENGWLRIMKFVLYVLYFFVKQLTYKYFYY